MVIVISADEIKKELLDYNPSRAEVFHRESAKKADKLFEEFLKSSQLSEVILFNGGAASGKTEFLATHLQNKSCIIFDTTLSTNEGAKIKIRNIYKSNKKAKIYSVIQDDLTRAFIAFLNRERKFSDKHFYKTHSGSRKTLLWIAKQYPEIEITIIESSYTEKQILQFDKINFDNLEQMITYLESIQMSENDIINSIHI